jgi:hypothetical protein
MTGRAISFVGTACFMEVGKEHLMFEKFYGSMIIDRIKMDNSRLCLKYKE